MRRESCTGGWVCRMIVTSGSLSSSRSCFKAGFSCLWRWQPPHRLVVGMAMPHHDNAWQDTLCWSCSARHVVGTAMPRHNSAWQDTLLVLLSKAPDKIRVSRCMADMQPHAAQLCTVGRVGLTDSCSNKKSFTCGTCLAAAHLISGWGHFLCVVVD